MGIFNRSRVYGLNESVSPVTEGEFHECFEIVGESDLSYECSVFCAGIQEASNQWSMEIGLDELDYAQTFGEELVYESENGAEANKKNGGKLKAFFAGIIAAIKKFFGKIKTKIVTFFSKLSGKAKAIATTAGSAEKAAGKAMAAKRAAQASEAQRAEAAKAIENEMVYPYSAEILDIDGWKEMVDIGPFKDAFDQFFGILADIDDKISLTAGRNKPISGDDLSDWASGNRVKPKEDDKAKDDKKGKDDKKEKEEEAKKPRNYTDDEVRGGADAYDKQRLDAFSKEWIENGRLGESILSMFCGAKAGTGRLTNQSVEYFGNFLASFYRRGDGKGDSLKGNKPNENAKIKLGNIVDSINSSKAWTYDTMSANYEKIASTNAVRSLQACCDKSEREIEAQLKRFEKEAGRFEGTAVIATAQRGLTNASQYVMRGCSEFVQACVGYSQELNIVYNKFLSALAKVEAKAAPAAGEKTEDKKEEKKEDKAKNESYSFMSAFSSIC